MDLEVVWWEVELICVKGQGENCQIVEMDLVNVSVKYEMLQVQLDGCMVCVFFVGIVVVVFGLVGEQGSCELVQVGSKLGQGQVLFGLVSVEWLKVFVKVFELDINQLCEGQVVEISGDGFEGIMLVGVIVVFGGQVLFGMVQGGSLQFEVMVLVVLFDFCQLQKICLGMSVKLMVIIYCNEQVIVVLLEVICYEGDWLFVDVCQVFGVSVMV